jgi:hypothetical protein
MMRENNNNNNNKNNNPIIKATNFKASTIFHPSKT